MAQISSKAAPVSFQRVSKVYGRDVVAVDSIDLQIDAGRLVTLLGPSGCGKTTTLRMIAGLEMATNGRILIGDKDVTGLPATDRDVSMVFQSYALFPHMTVLENVSYGLRFSGHGKTETRDRALAGLDLVGLKGFDDPVAQRTVRRSGSSASAVARALVLEPQVLLFDEPLSNLDGQTSPSGARRHSRHPAGSWTDGRLRGPTIRRKLSPSPTRSSSCATQRWRRPGRPRELYDAPVDEFVADFIGEGQPDPDRDFVCRGRDRRNHR